MALPTKVWPLPLNYINVTSSFGPRTITVDGVTKKQSRHGAIDISAPVGTPVFSIDSGIVHKTVLDHPVAGHYVEIKHKNGTYSRYLHLSDIQVKVGQQLRTGSKIGLSGGGVGIRGAGATTGPHLHLEIWKGGPPYQGGSLIDPQPYLLELAKFKITEAIKRNSGLLIAASGASLLILSLVFGRRIVRSNPPRLTTVHRP